MRFTPATEFTRTCFNRYGIKPADAVLECTVCEPGYASYDLTVLSDGAVFYAAHGAVVMPRPFSTSNDAKAALKRWYQVNKSKAAIY
jgi:hypothetical protein